MERRSFLAGALGLGALAGLGTLTGCGLTGGASASGRQDHQADRHGVRPLPGADQDRPEDPRGPGVEGRRQVRHRHRAAELRRGQRRVRRQLLPARRLPASSSPPTRTWTWTRRSTCTARRAASTPAKHKASRTCRQAQRSRFRWTRPTTAAPWRCWPKPVELKITEGKSVIHLSQNDILENPKNFSFVEVDQQSLSKTLPDVDAGFLFVRLGAELGLKPRRTRCCSKRTPTRCRSSASWPRSRASRETEKGKALEAAYHSDEVKDWFKDYIGGVLAHPVGPRPDHRHRQVEHLTHSDTLIPAARQPGRPPPPRPGTCTRDLRNKPRARAGTAGAGAGYRGDMSTEPTPPQARPRATPMIPPSSAGCWPPRGGGPSSGSPQPAAGRAGCLPVPDGPARHGDRPVSLEGRGRPRPHRLPEAGRESRARWTSWTAS